MDEDYNIEIRVLYSGCYKQPKTTFNVSTKCRHGDNESIKL